MQNEPFRRILKVQSASSLKPLRKGAAMIRKLATLIAVFTPLAFVSADMTAHDNGTFQSQRLHAIQMNTLAGNLHTPEEAHTLVGLFAEEFSVELPGKFTDRRFLDHLAGAEFNAAHDPARGIAEEQVAAAWNTYLDAINAPPETRVTPAEIHSLRDGDYAISRVFWRPGMETIWIMPALHNTQPDGSLAHNCRPLEALLMLWDIDNIYENLEAARYRIRHGIVLSEQFKQRKPASTQDRATVSISISPPNPVAEAEHRFAQQHGNRQLRAARERLAESLLAGH